MDSDPLGGRTEDCGPGDETPRGGAAREQACIEVEVVETTRGGEPRSPDRETKPPGWSVATMMSRSM